MSFKFPLKTILVIFMATLVISMTSEVLFRREKKKNLYLDESIHI